MSGGQAGVLQGDESPGDRGSHTHSAGNCENPPGIGAAEAHPGDESTPAQDLDLWGSPQIRAPALRLGCVKPEPGRATCILSRLCLAPKARRQLKAWASARVPIQIVNSAESAIQQADFISTSRSWRTEKHEILGRCPRLLNESRLWR